MKNWIQLLLRYAALLVLTSGFFEARMPAASQPAQVSHAEARHVLEQILARPEFTGNAPPNAWDGFRERIARWIAQWLSGLIQVGRESPRIASGIFWMLVACLIALVRLCVWWIQSRREAALKLTFSTLEQRVGTWQAWIEAARASAARNDLSAAIQCAYWAAIARLQDLNALPRDFTRTPREYLRLLAGRTAATGERALVPALKAMTSQLERVWYGNGTASAEDFGASMRVLEALGCRPD